MTLVYQSTRDANNTVSASQAILQGLATDGGLFRAFEERIGIIISLIKGEFSEKS